MHSWVLRLARRDLPIWAVFFWFRGMGLGNAIGRSNRISTGPIYALIGSSDDPKPYCVAIVGGIPRSGVGLRDENHFGTYVRLPTGGGSGPEHSSSDKKSPAEAGPCSSIRRLRPAG